MKIIYFFLMTYLTTHSDVTINNDTVYINNLEINQSIVFDNGLLNTINFNDNASINGDINFNKNVSLSNLSLINTDLFHIFIDQNNKVWKADNDISQEIITVNTINAYQNNITINNPNNTIIFNSDTNTNTININQINQIINNHSNFTTLYSQSTANETFNIIGKNTTGSITTDNDITLSIVSPLIISETLKGNINIILPGGIFAISNNYILNINTIDNTDNHTILTITDENKISNRLNVKKYTNIYNKDILNINAPTIKINNPNITLKTDKLFLRDDLLYKINDSVKTITSKKLMCISANINTAIFKGDNIRCNRIYLNDINAKITAYGKDFIFINLIDSPDSYLRFSSNISKTTTGVQLVLDANEELFYLAQSSREFKENIRPLRISSDRFLEIFQDINNIQSNQDLIRTLENTELKAVIIYDENKEPIIIEERGLMAIAAAQLNNISNVLQSLENELEKGLNN